jgi:hypothetical protein
MGDFKKPAEFSEKILRSYITNYQYCIFSKADRSEPEKTIIYKQLQNIRNHWEYQERIENRENKEDQQITADLHNETIDYDFKFECLPGYNNNWVDPTKKDQNYFIYLIEINDELRDHVVEKLDYKVYDNKKAFLTKYSEWKPHNFELIHDWMSQQAILWLLNQEFSLNDYTNENIVLDHFPMHEFHERQEIMESWKRNWWIALVMPLGGGEDLRGLRPITQIALYHGIKTGLYFGFQVTLVS